MTADDSSAHREQAEPGEQTDDRTHADDRAPTFDEILEWLEGRLPAAAAASVEQRCRRAGPAVAEQVQWVRWFLGNAREVPLTAPPPLVTQRLRRLAGRRRRPPEPPRRLDAVLVTDTRGADQVVGVRAPVLATEDRFQLTYRAGDVDVVLDVARDGPDTLHVRGQVLVGQGVLPVFEAAAHGPFGTVRSILGDELGGFDLAVPDTVSSMTMTNDEILVELELPRAATP